MKKIGLPEVSISSSLGVVAIVLAVGIATAINAVTIGILAETFKDPAHNGITDNATQILTSAFTGVFGILGAYVGYRAANGHPKPIPPPEEGEVTEDTVELPPQSM